MKIGFIGLGLMGSRMAANLAKSGFHLKVHSRTESNAHRLFSESVQWKASPELVAKESEVIITMLSAPEAVQSVALGEYGFLPALKKGSVWIDCSTVNPSFSKEMAEITSTLGSNFLDAPVAGSIGPAEKGELVFMVGGKKSVVKYCNPVFNAMGKKYVHVGDNGMGAALKMVNNLVMGLSMYAFIEGLVLGESYGISREAIFNLLEGSPVVAPMVTMKKKKIIQSEFSPEFPLQWLHKDLHLATITAWEQGVAMPGVHAVKEVFGLAKQAGYGEKDFTAILSFLKNLNSENHEV
jgi:3-hydroxyisobutyrate dehydrogenase/glyoxylate/succinic semialdehyde reductase